MPNPPLDAGSSAPCQSRYPAPRKPGREFAAPGTLAPLRVDAASLAGLWGQSQGRFRAPQDSDKGEFESDGERWWCFPLSGGVERSSPAEGTAGERNEPDVAKSLGDR